LLIHHIFLLIWIEFSTFDIYGTKNTYYNAIVQDSALRNPEQWRYNDVMTFFNGLL